MSDLVRTLLLAGLLSGTQPVTVMGLLLVMSSDRPNRKGLAYIAGAFLVESAILLFSGFVIGDTVAPSSGMGHLFFIVRTVLGVALLVAGLRMRRPPKKPAPAVPKALERLQGLSVGKSFVAGLALADYQGPFLASLALATASVELSGRLLALAFYTLLASGIPLAVFVVTARSAGARDKMHRSTGWVMAHRRQLGSWFALILGALIVSDSLFVLLTSWTTG